MRTGRILDSRRTRQQVVQQKFALRVKARFNPFQDSVGCTIAMRWQRRLKSNRSEDQTLFLQPGRGTVHIFLRASLTGRRFTVIPNRKAYANEKQILLMFCTTIWRTTTRTISRWFVSQRHLPFRKGCTAQNQGPTGSCH